MLIGAFNPPCPQKDEIVYLLLAGGGNVVQDTEARDKHFKQQHCDKEVLWIVDKRTRRPPRHANQVVYYKWVLDSISGFQLLPFRFYLL